MEAGIFFSLFIVAENEKGEASIFFLPRDLQTREMFTMRKPLAASARRAGWIGFMIDTSKALAPPMRYHAMESRSPEPARDVASDLPRHIE